MAGFKNANFAGLFMLMILVSSTVPSFADSTVIDGPGFKVEKRQGWFGRKSTVYQDALGNTVERKRGFFGRESSRTKVFGSETVKDGNNIQVTGPNGETLIQKKKTLFGGEQTRIDGNGLLESVKNILNP